MSLNLFALGWVECKSSAAFCGVSKTCELFVRMSKTCDLFVRMGTKLVVLCEDECKACVPSVRMRV
jgi:hypothetical protein